MAPPESAQEFKAEFDRFSAKYPDLLTLLKSSPYYEPSRQNFLRVTASMAPRGANPQHLTTRAIQLQPRTRALPRRSRNPIERSGIGRGWMGGPLHKRNRHSTLPSGIRRRPHDDVDILSKTRQVSINFIRLESAPHQHTSTRPSSWTADKNSIIMISSVRTPISPHPSLDFHSVAHQPLEVRHNRMHGPTRTTQKQPNITQRRQPLR
jgi:hypothetical protein